MGTATAAGELLTAGTVWINGLGSTAVGCRPPLRDQEEWLKTFLTSKPSWRLNGDELTLTAGGTTITLLDGKVAEPDFPLDGIRWKITTTITNADARQGYGRTEEAWLTFDAGHLTGWTGSNELSATYTRNIAPTGKDLDLIADQELVVHAAQLASSRGREQVTVGLCRK